MNLGSVASGRRFAGKRSGGTICVMLCLMAGLGGMQVRAAQRMAAETNSSGAMELRLDDYLRMVVEHNDTLQAQMLLSEASRRKARAEYGIFEPALTAAIVREATKRTNNVKEQAAQSGNLYFDERNTIIDGGLESTVPTGGKIRLGYTQSYLVNNVQPFIFGPPVTTNYNRQYATFVGVTVTQPLLKNGGTAVTLANIRLGALESDIAFQEYRRQLMIVLSQAEAAYWDLYFTQEQLNALDLSVGVAESLLADSQKRSEAGRASELDVLEAQSGLALRKTKQNTARQQFYEALGRVRMLYGASPLESAPALKAVDVPKSSEAPPKYADTFGSVFELNPDYLIQKTKVDQEGIRLGVARNQLLPELNAKAAYGFNGLGATPGDAWDVAQSHDFPSWSVGVELRVPLAGGIKARNEFAASKLNWQSSLVTLRNIETQLANALQTAIQKTRTSQDSVESYRTIVQFAEDVLKTERARFDIGRVDGRKVLEVEAELFDARQNLAQSLVQYERARLEIELASGSVLQRRGLDITRDELRRQTRAMLGGQRLPEAVFTPVIINRNVPKAN